MISRVQSTPGPHRGRDGENWNLKRLMGNPQRGDDQSSTLLEWSGRRDSNPRPMPWQGIALSTELLPQ